VTDTARAYWNRVARRYAERRIGDEAAYAAALARTRAHLPADARVLELGCGTGTTALRLAGAAAAIEAWDFSEEMVAIARERAAEAGAAHVAFRCGDPFAAAAPGAAFDAVLAFNLLHLLDDLDAALGWIRAALRADGVFVSKTVCLKALSPPLRLVVWGLRRGGVLPPDMAAFSADALERRIAGAGFEIVETGLYPRKPPGRFIVARRA
jgi:SAM-dependent methyltransferase